MRRMALIAGLLALPLGGCYQYDAPNNGHSIAYLVDNPAQIDAAREQARTECARYQREPGLYNATRFQHLLVVFDCRPPDDARFQVKPAAAAQ